MRQETNRFGCFKGAPRETNVVTRSSVLPALRRGALYALASLTLVVGAPLTFVAHVELWVVGGILALAASGWGRDGGPKVRARGAVAVALAAAGAVVAWVALPLGVFSLGAYIGIHGVEVRHPFGLDGIAFLAVVASGLLAPAAVACALTLRGYRALDAAARADAREAAFAAPVFLAGAIAWTSLVAVGAWISREAHP